MIYFEMIDARWQTRCHLDMHIFARERNKIDQGQFHRQFLVIFEDSTSLIRSRLGYRINILIRRLCIRLRLILFFLLQIV